MNSMKKFSLMIAAATLLMLAGCGTKRSQAYYSAPSQVLSDNYDGTYVIRTQVRARNAAIAFTDGQRKAMTEVIFDGVRAGNNGVQDLKPLCLDLNGREKHEAYFQVFFKDKGEWTNYASLQDKRTTTTHYQRDGRQMVETVTVTIDRAGLKKKLQEDGIIPVEGRY